MSKQENEKTGIDDNRIDLVDLLMKYLKIFSKMWWKLLLVVALFTGLVCAGGKFRDSVRYRAYSVFTVSSQWGTDGSASTSYYDNVTAEQLSSTFPHILTSDLLREKVAEDMGTAGVSGSIQVSNTADTNIMTMTVTDSDAQRAWDTLQSVLRNYPMISEMIIGKTVLTVLDESGVPTEAIHSWNLQQSIKSGLILGMAIAFAWLTLVVLTRKTIRKESDIRKSMNIACLGSVPEIIRKQRSSKEENHKLLLTEPHLESVLSEPLRNVRNKVEYHAQTQGMKTFLLTSALPGEGKSTIAVNLAVSLAQSGKKVTLIDGDLRHPTDRKIFGIEDGSGLAEVLKGEAKLEEVLLKPEDLGIKESLPFLFIPGGKPIDKSSELLDKSFELFEDIVRTMKEESDYVLIDSAPVGLLTDAVILAKQGDGVLYVVRKDCASVGHIRNGMEVLDDQKIRIIGGILNGV